MDINDILKDASEIVEERWQIERGGETAKDAPRCEEAAEDEAKEIEAFVLQRLKERIKGFHDSRVERIERLSSNDLADVTVYDTRGYVQYRCGKCGDLHEAAGRAMVLRMSPGSPLIPLGSEILLDQQEREADVQVIQVRLPDIIGSIAEALKDKMSDKGDGDPLPPAAHEESALRQAWQKLWGQKS